MVRDTDPTRRDFVQIAAAAGAWLATGAAGVSAEPPPILRAGAAKQDITPTKPVHLAGYGSRKDLSQGIHDPLSARAVAFEHGGQRLLLVSTDFLGFYGGTAASLRKAIIEACGLRPSELFLAAIHTHSAPTPTLGGADAHPNNVAWTKSLETQLVAVVREALARLAHAEIAFACGSSPVGVNRREPVRNAAGKTVVQLGRNPNVLTDREVQVLRVSRAGTGEPLAALFAYATHSTAMGPHNYLVSGDVHGLAEQFLEKQLGGAVVAPGFAGASGDIDPWFRVLPRFATANGWIPEAVLLGTMLGEEIAHVLEGIKKPGPVGAIRTAMKTLVLPPRPGPRGESPEKSLGLSGEFNLTVARLGDVAVVGLGGEVFNDIGKAIKAASPFPHTIVITHCNGAAGYLPTKEACPDGGYGVDNSPFGPAAAEQVVQEARRMLGEVRSAER
jgi:hypothetical protein